MARLTRREREILGLVARGLSNIAIAELLVVSPRTVDAHIRHIYNALDLADQWEHNRRVLATLDHVAFTTRQQLQEGLALAAAA